MLCPSDCSLFQKLISVKLFANFISVEVEWYSVVFSNLVLREVGQLIYILKLVLLQISGFV